MGDESGRSRDNGDLLEDLSEPEESGELRFDALDIGDQAESSRGVDAGGYALGSMALSADVDESGDLELVRDDISARSESEADALSPREGDANVRGSCDELEAKIDAMLGEDGEEPASALVPPMDDAPIATTADNEMIQSGHIGSNECDPEVISQDPVHDESCTEGTEAKTNDSAAPSETTAINYNDVPVTNMNTAGCCTTDSIIPDSMAKEHPVTADTYEVSEASASPPATKDETPGAHIIAVTAMTEDDSSRRQPHLGAGYSVATVFPVVYEPVIPHESKPGLPDKDTSETSPSVSLICSPPVGSAPDGNSSKRAETQRAARLQRQLEAAERELRGSKKAFVLQLSVLEGEKKILSTRNARLHSQLASATTELQRVSSELARARTENELYAAKLPQLQADLLQETTQVDEGRSQSLQAQLSIGQLKARAQVIQKRNEALEAANSKLVVKLREASQELRRKADAIEQQADKIALLETSVRDHKNRHNEAMLAWKHRLATASQRAQQDLSKASSEWKLKSEKVIADAKRKTDRGEKRRRELEASILKLEQAAEQHKRDSCVHQEHLASAKKEVAAVKAVVKKLTQTEAALRCELAALRSRLRDAESGHQKPKERTAAPHRTSRRQDAASDARRTHSPRLNLLQREADQLDSRLGSFGGMFADVLAVNPSTSDAATMTAASVEACPRCPQLAQQTRDARRELTRVRALHTQELRAQLQAMNSALKAHSLARQVQSA